MAGCPNRYTDTGLRGKGVNAHMPLRIAPKPELPAHAHDWASQAHTRNFIDMPFGEFLGPPWGMK